MPRSSNASANWLAPAFDQPAFRERLAEIGDGEGEILFTQIDPAAQAWLLAVVEEWRAARHPDARLWVTCPLPRHRERLADEFPLWSSSPALVLPDPSDTPGAADAPEATAERLGALHRLAGDEPLVTIGSPGMFDSPAPTPESLLGARFEIARTAVVDPHEFTEKLAAHGYDRVERIEGRGQFAVRGGIVDVFPWERPHPLRIEWFDYEIESLREFDVHSQQSLRRLDRTGFLLSEPETSATLAAYRKPGDWVVTVGEGTDEAHVRILESAPPDGPADDPCACIGKPVGSFDAGDFILQEALRRTFFEQLAQWQAERWRVLMVFSAPGERDRFAELAGKPFDELGIDPVEGDLLGSFMVPALRFAAISSSELFGRYRQPGAARRGQLSRQRSAAVRTHAEDLREGDIVVHTEYGIGRYLGTETDEDGEQLVIEYRDDARLYVPIDQAHLVGRYVGLGGRSPRLSKLGGNSWKNTRKHAEQAILDYAARLLRVQAERQSRPGTPHLPDSRWMWEFENSFHFTETPDQNRAIAEVKHDMEHGRPMDRLICGDVGFGKTEVAIRAAFKAVTGGRQAAVLVPTTVLAEQHWRTFRERMSDYPIRIDLLNRFRTAAQVRSTLNGLADGSVDIVIGTHRLISKDVHFENLGLVVIDEEQRFGVQHKERFKELFRQIDVLTLSATPIPRTLYLALMGARDMSTIDTPPPNRTPVHTTVAAYDERLIRNAIHRELKRGGQVFYLHNRVQSIETVRNRLNELVPEAKIIVGHGQMPKDELEVVMRRFVRGEADILLATTIIENGIDIPNANTILIDRADRFGLADLYQLRGRVGRAGEQAYAILLLPRGGAAGGDARKRINAIKQYTALGSGFKIAMRDLEIRGAGNLLGTKQSGQIAAIGFDLYCQLLRQSIEHLQGKSPRQRPNVAFRADFISFQEGRDLAPDTLPAWLPATWLPESRLRVAAFRELAELFTEADLEALAARWRDRFGRIPTPALNLLETHRIRLLAAERNLDSVEIRGQRLMLVRNRDYIMLEGRRFPRLKSTKPVQKLAETIQLLRSL